MNPKKADSAGKRIMEKTMDDLLVKRKAPLFVFFLLLFLYFASTVVVALTAGSTHALLIAGGVIGVYAFAGVFSSVANICTVLLTVYFEKAGFYTGLLLNLISFPRLIIRIVVDRNISVLPGLFVNLLAVIATVAIFLNNQKINKYQTRLLEQAVTDMLTKIPNRFACSELLNDLVKKKEPFVAVAIDLDGFKEINDAMGFDVGNGVLIEAASRWKNIADKGLSGTLDFISRLGGDEFALIIRNYKSEEEVIRTISQYDEAIMQKMTISDYDLYITASFGYAQFPQDGEDIDSLFSHATTAMTEVKKRNSTSHIAKFTQALLKNDRTLELETRIRTALEKDEFFFNLQPQYDMDHKLRGFEALARLKDDNGAFISPAEFITVAEKIGVIDKVDLAVFRKAAVFAGKLLKESGADFILSINVSVRHLMKNDFLAEVRKILEISGLPAANLEIEITESIMIESVEKAFNCIEEIKKMGIRIAIDDFGTGYSSLSYLSNFPADLLKIDKAFIDKMNLSESSKQYVAAIISLGHIMGIEVISEGVEKHDQLDTLKTIGCDYIQGYIWGRPLPADDIRKLVMA